MYNRDYQKNKYSIIIYNRGSQKKKNICWKSQKIMAFKNHWVFCVFFHETWWFFGFEFYSNTSTQRSFHTKLSQIPGTGGHYKP
jgi:hypothetical protein